MKVEEMIEDTHLIMQETVQRLGDKIRPEYTILDPDQKLKRFVAAQAARQAERRQVSTSAASADWDTVFDQVNKLWTSNEQRATALGKGRFIVAALDLLQKAEAEIGKGDEATDRSVGRVLDRIAGIVSGEAAWIAAMYVERSRGK